MAIITPGNVLSHPAKPTKPSYAWATITASMESATNSRDTKLIRMPLWFIDKPSDTETVVKDTGIPCSLATPNLAASACGPSDKEHGVVSPCWLTMPTKGLPKSVSATPIARKKARCGVRSIPSVIRADLRDWRGLKGFDSVGIFKLACVRRLLWVGETKSKIKASIKQ